MKRRSLGEVMARARAEFAINSTITVYEFEDGEEWLRRAANPYITLRDSFARLSEGFSKTSAAVESFSRTLSRTLKRALEGIE